MSTYGHGLQVREIGIYLKKMEHTNKLSPETHKKLKAIQEFDSDTKNHIFATIDAFIKASKLKNVAAL